MSEAKHTPGPWQWTQHFDPTISIYKDGFGQIARLYDSSAGTGKANARLIAAAPDLLDALEGIIGYFDSGNSVSVSQATIKASSDEIKAARAAIAKATGCAA